MAIGPAITIATPTSAAARATINWFPSARIGAWTRMNGSAPTHAPIGWAAPRPPERRDDEDRAAGAQRLDDGAFAFGVHQHDVGQCEHALGIGLTDDRRRKWGAGVDAVDFDRPAREASRDTHSRCVIAE